MGRDQTRHGRQQTHNSGIFGTIAVSSTPLPRRNVRPAVSSFVSKPASVNSVTFRVSTKASGSSTEMPPIENNAPKAPEAVTGASKVGSSFTLFTSTVTVATSERASESEMVKVNDAKADPNASVGPRYLTLPPGFGHIDTIPKSGAIKLNQ